MISQHTSFDPRDVVRLNLPANFKYLNILSTSIAEMLQRAEGISELVTVSYNLQLAAQEVCTNIVDHAYRGINDGRIGVQLRLDNHAHMLTVDIHDTGTSFDINAAKSPQLGTLQVRGFGLFLIQQLLDEVHYFPQPGNNRWTLTKHLAIE